MIWERAVSKVAPEFGISDVALRKQCVKHAIPLPDATYWGRLHAGRPVKRKPLGPAPAGTSDTIIIAPKAPPLPEPITSAIGQARQTGGQIIVPDKLHPLVAKTLAVARKAQPDQHGAVTKLGSEVFHIRAHPETLERVGTFLNALVYQAKSRDYRFVPGRDGLEVVADNEAIAFSVYQTIRRTRHVETEEERRRVERWDARHRHNRSSWQGRPTIPYYDFLPTGEMVIELGRWTRYEGVQRRFADTRSRKIEERIGEVLVSFAAFAAGEKVERARAQERAQSAEIARLGRAEQARLAKLEANRVEFLEQKLLQVEERDRLAAFLASLEGRCDHPDHECYREFRSWVQQRLAGMNARLSREAIARELSEVEAFAPTSVGAHEGGSDTQI
jgi:muconolactone delta-isomerase